MRCPGPALWRIHAEAARIPNSAKKNLLTQGKMKNGIFLSALASKPLQNVWCWNERKFNSKQMIQFWDFWPVNTLPRAGNSLIGFPRKSFIFCPKISKWAIRSKNKLFTHLQWLAHVRSFPLSDLSESLMVALFWWATWAIRSHCPQKRGNERIANFLNKKSHIKHTKK